MSLLLRCHNIEKSFGDRAILSGLDLEIHAGQHIGLVGRNGSGKSTLVQILAGIIEPEQGQISYNPPGLSLGLLRQDGSALLLSVPDCRSSTGHLSDQGHMLSRLKLKHLDSDPEVQIQYLSGGERTRLALARLWAGQPRLLILDEPTNNLDIEGMEWLAGELSRLPAAVIVISHDRRFLDQAVNRIVELEDSRLHHYNGNYSYYRQEKERLCQAQLHAYESRAREERRLEAMVRHLRGWSDKGYRESRSKGRKSGNLMGGKEYYRAKAEKQDRAVKSRIHRLEKMRQEGPQRPRKERAARFQGLESGSGGRRLLAACELAMSFGEQNLFEASDFWVNRGEKTAIVGPNGCGKSTLLRIIMGLQEASDGELFISPSSRVAYISQDAPLQDLPALRERLAGAGRSAMTRICTAMAGLGLDYAALGRPSQDLSPGERMKIALALAIDARPELIILDEPGNHLDLFSVESLQKSLQEYEGSLLLVSHDVYLVQAVCDCLLVFENRCISRRDCGIVDYLEAVRVPKHPAPGKKPGKSAISKQPDAGDSGLSPEETLLLEIQIAWVLGQLGAEKPGSPRYEDLEARYRELCRQKSGGS